jgi:ferredoxin
VESDRFGALLAALQRRGYRTVGPTVRDGAIVYDEIATVADLPAGWTDEQDGGTYRLKRRSDGALFGYAVGPHSWKKYLFPPLLRLWRAERQGDSLVLEAEAGDPPLLALIGVRSCELHAIAIQDRVFLAGPHVDPHYAAQRRNLFILAVNCGQAAHTCFCVSMDAGPAVKDGFDLALTEVLEGEHHYFLAQAGSALGAEVLAEVAPRPAREDERAAARLVVQRTAAQMGRVMDTAGLKDLLYRNYDHPRWDDVASRCLSCGNCTMVCPTCFCSTVEDSTDITGTQSERRRRWDSCFTMDFSYIHGGSVRATPRARYRQWMTHKLATWWDQFGSSGCVGCGRCITWCPVGIDITAEVQAIRASQPAPPRADKEHANDAHS